MEHDGRYYPVLDHGFVALKDMMGCDKDIEEMARVSYQAGTRTVSDTRGLLRYLMRHRHTSPFERVELVFHVGLPIFVARQWIRHRTASVNEYSGRYSVMPMIFYTPEEDRVTTQNTENKQGSSDDIINGYDAFVLAREEIRDTSAAHYRACIEMDVARETARIDLPLSMYTYWYWKIDLHNLFHFLSLRLDPHAQWEIQQYAHVIANIVASELPLSWEAFYDYKMNACSFSRMEMELIRGGLYYNMYQQPHITTTNKHAMQLGMNTREIKEFWNKLSKPNLELQELPQHKSPEYFMEKIEKAS